MYVTRVIGIQWFACPGGWGTGCRTAMSHWEPHISHCDMQHVIVFCCMQCLMKIVMFTGQTSSCQTSFESVGLPDLSDAFILPQLCGNFNANLGLCCVIYGFIVPIWSIGGLWASTIHILQFDSRNCLTCL
jgi:hypothetical protein